MKARNVVQALWPGVWSVGALVTLFNTGDPWFLVLLPVLVPWLIVALLLHPSRPWSWWACLAPLAFAVLLGLGALVGFSVLLLGPDTPDTDNRPGALLVLGGLVYLVPSSLLLWHLLAIRGQFRHRSSVA